MQLFTYSFDEYYACVLSLIIIATTRSIYNFCFETVNIERTCLSVSLDAIDRTLTEFSTNNNNNNNNCRASMSAATAARSPFQTHGVSEESYCSPWDLKSQEEKFKLLSEKRPTTTTTTNAITSLTDALLHPSSNTNNRSTTLSSLNNNNNQNPFQRTRSARTTSSTKKSFTLREPSPPLLPPLPPGGLIPPVLSSSPSSTTNITCQCGSNSNTRNRSSNTLNTNNNNNSINESLDPSLKKISYCLNAHVVRSGTDTSRSFVFAQSSPSNEHSQRVNTAPAKVDLSHIVEQQSESININSQCSTISSSSTESPLITDDTKPMSFEVRSFIFIDKTDFFVCLFLLRLLYNDSND